MGTFVLLQLYNGVAYFRSLLPEALQRSLFRWALILFSLVFAVLFLTLSALGYVAPWTGRFYTLLDPTYAKSHIPIIASVSEHQPTTWSSFFFDLHILSLLMPAGLFVCFMKPSDQNVFAILYGLTSTYFAGVMVRLMLVIMLFA